MIGPVRPLPRQNLTTGLVLISPVDGEPLGTIVEVVQATVIAVETDRGDIEEVRVTDTDPAPLVAEILPEPEPAPE